MLKRLRMMSGLTLREAAEISGMSRETIRKWECGRPSSRIAFHAAKKTIKKLTLLAKKNGHEVVPVLYVSESGEIKEYIKPAIGRRGNQ